MRILHTSDWHLGKLFHAVNLIDDQRHALEQILAMVRDEKPDAVVVAGDIYDRSVPPADAVALLDWVLTELVLGLRTPTIVIAGNHDSADRLHFGSRLLDRNGLHVLGKLGGLRPIEVGQGADTAFICPCPFVDAASARESLQDPRITTQDAVLRAVTTRFRQALAAGARALLAAHAFVAGGSASDSERPLSVGGTDQVAVDCFDGFSYVALGHLHGPQDIVASRVRYSGSLLKYSKSEVGKSKSVSLVNLESAGAVVRELPLVPKRDVREVEGLLAELEGGSVPASDDYLYVRLLDRAMPLNAMARLRVRFPNVVDVDVSTAVAAVTGAPPGQSLLELDDISLFDSFMRAATGAGLTAEDRELVAAAIRAVDGDAQVIS